MAKSAFLTQSPKFESFVGSETTSSATSGFWEAFTRCVVWAELPVIGAWAGALGVPLPLDLLLVSLSTRQALNQSHSRLESYSVYVKAIKALFAREV